MLQWIRESLLDYADVIVWDNSVEDDRKVFGRYMAATYARTDWVYFQDDDVVVPRSTQRALLNAGAEWPVVANWGHGENPDGYEDLPLVCGGALVYRPSIEFALSKYREQYELDEEFDYEADFVIGVLYPVFKHIYEPFVINYKVAQHPSRLVNQPWQKELKRKMTDRARAIRDGAKVTA